MPVVLLFALLTNAFTIGYVWLEIYLVREWFLHKDLLTNQEQDYAQRCLIIAILLFVFSILGHRILPYLVSKIRKNEDAPKLERFPEQRTIKRPDGSIINVEYGGTPGKQPIVFIHGWNSNSMQWYYQKKYFAKDYYLVLMDHAGLGLSKKPKNNDYSLDKLGRDLNAVIEHSKLKNPVLWGHSMGGFTILTWCKLYPQKLSSIKGIILEHTTYTNPVKTAIMSSLLTKIQNPVLRPLCWIMVALSSLLWISKWMSFLNGSSLVMTRFLTFAGTQSPQQLNFTSLLSTMAAPEITGRGVLGMFEYEAIDILKKINISTLVIGAGADKLTKLEASITMAQRIPGAKLLTLDPAGHMGLCKC
jgi:pimeloyl-ACP methyl ester carboxylesterase